MGDAVDGDEEKVQFLAQKWGIPREEARRMLKRGEVDG